MCSIDQFLSLVDRYAAATGLADGTIGTRLLNDGKGITRLRSGRDIGVRKMQEVLGRLSSIWPEDAEWPSDIPRPAKSAALERALELAGGPSGLATALAEHGLSITSQAISQWSRVPAERVLHVEAVTGVTRNELRPDIYPEPVL